LPPPERPNLLPGLAASPLRQVQQRLEQLVEHDEERAAAILKQWLQESEGA
jgi:flagellar M-ring protein FliF